MRIIVRGIRGNLKLNPAITLWGGVALAVVLIGGALAYQILAFREKVQACQRREGVWIGGTLPSAYCAESKDEDRQW